jgi:hypothetical protein
MFSSLRHRYFSATVTRSVGAATILFKYSHDSIAVTGALHYKTTAHMPSTRWAYALMRLAFAAVSGETPQGQPAT